MPTKTQQLIDLSAKIKELEHIITEKNVEVEKVKTELKSSNQAKDSWYKSYQDVDSEIKQLHEILDYLPNKVPRQAEDGYTNIKISVRLACWLASR